MSDFKKEYIDLFKNILLGTHYQESSWERLYNNHKRLISWPISMQFFRDLIIKIFQNRSIILFKEKKHDPQKAIEGKGTSGPRYTAVSKKRLDNIEFCINEILKNQIEGDFIETGVWRGGSCIFMRELLRINNVTDRKVYVADSFEGMPIPKDNNDGPDHSLFDSAKVSLEQVKSNFKTFNLDDEQVLFVKGWFSESLPKANIGKLSLLRLDGDLYHSTMDSLNNLYKKVSKGGFVIIDDYNDWPECKRAVTDFRNNLAITSEIKNIDWTGIYWKVE